MRQAIFTQILRALFFFGSLILTTTMFFLMAVQGLVVQLSGNWTDAAVFYLVGATALSAAIWIYSKGRKILLTMAV